MQDVRRKITQKGKNTKEEEENVKEEIGGKK